MDVESILSIYEAMYPIEGIRYVFLDEIQYTENWELWMKVIYDSRKDFRLMATGSASPVLEKVLRTVVQADGVSLKFLLCRLMNIADCVSLMSLSCQIICALQSC